MLLQIVFLVYMSQGTNSILCYNCTFSHREFGLDPIWNRGLFSSRRAESRIRCAVTVKCPAMLWLLSSALLWGVSEALLCYNCSTTFKDTPSYFSCSGEFAPPGGPFNTSRKFLVNCTEEGAMCFVRSWSERARHSWLVQRGCYTPEENDPLPAAMNLPARAMSCRRERFPEAEYKVCLCQADWCNTSPQNTPLSHHAARTIAFCILLHIVFT